MCPYELCALINIWDLNSQTSELFLWTWFMDVKEFQQYNTQTLESITIWYQKSLN